MIILNIILLVTSAMLIHFCIEVMNEIARLKRDNRAINTVLLDRTENLNYRVGLLEMANEVDTAEFEECEGGVCKLN